MKSRMSRSVEPLDDTSRRAFAAGLIVLAAAATEREVLVTAGSYCSRGTTCWFGLLGSHLESLLERPIVLAHGRFAGLGGRILIVHRESPLVAAVDLLTAPDAPPPAVDLRTLIVLGDDAITRIAAGTLLGGYELGAVDDIPSLPAELVLLGASSPGELVRRFTELGLEEQDLTITGL